MPFYSPRNESALRQFSDAVNDDRNHENQWAKHPEDFSLFCLGEYDDNTGVIIPKLSESLVNGASLKTDKNIGVVN